MSLYYLKFSYHILSMVTNIFFVHHICLFQKFVMILQTYRIRFVIESNRTFITLYFVYEKWIIIAKI